MPMLTRNKTCTLRVMYKRGFERIPIHARTHARTVRLSTHSHSHLRAKRNYFNCSPKIRMAFLDGHIVDRSTFTELACVWKHIPAIQVLWRHKSFILHTSESRFGRSHFHYHGYSTFKLIVYVNALMETTLLPVSIITLSVSPSFLRGISKVG